MNRHTRHSSVRPTNQSESRRNRVTTIPLICLLLVVGASRALAIVPSVSTQPPTSLTVSNGVLNGMVVANGLATTAWFQWGTNTTYGILTVVTNVGAGSNVVRISLPVSGVVPRRVYHCRLVATNASGLVYGADQPFALAGRVRAWGYNDSGQTAVPWNLSNVVAIAAGDFHSLALKSGGTVVAWGSNVWGQTNVPANLSTVVAIAGGGFHSLALGSKGTVVAWGYNGYGQTSVPLSLSNAVGIAGGYAYSMALRSDGTVVAWGDNRGGETNVPMNLSNVVAIAAGGSAQYGHSLALKCDGTVAAWGSNDFGQTNVPVNLSNVVGVAAGGVHSLALKSDGKVVAWGYNDYGQTNVPANLSNVVAIAAGVSHSLALKSDGKVVAWGVNGFGVISVPAVVSNVVAIAGGWDFSLALAASNSNSPPVGKSQTVFGSANTDTTITLSATDTDTDTLSLRVTSLPAAGTLYQYNGGSRGPAIASTNAVVSDSNGRVIFAPTPGGYGAPYASFQFVANDLEVDSAPAVVTLNILPQPQINAYGLTVGGAFQLAFSGISNVTYHVLASSNLASWFLLGPAAELAPGQFQFTDPEATNNPQRFYRVRSP